MKPAAAVAPANRFQRRRAQTRRELLNAARRVLASKGYHRAKIADIAREADVGVGTFYLYYTTKEALFTELVEETARILKRQLDAVRAQVRDPRERSRASLEMFFQFAREHRELFRIVFGHGAEFHDVVRRAQARFVADVRANLREGMTRGVFRRNRPEVLAPALIGMSDRVLSWWLEQEAVSLPAVTESLLDFVFHGLGATRTKPKRAR
jgi:AcrR family transcriptional regulator